MANSSKKKIGFWEQKSLNDLNDEEWEALCDGCGKCCLQKLQDDETEELHFTCISCRYLDSHTCQCRVYDKRTEYVPECLNLTKDNVVDYVAWLPETCAYKRVYFKKPLPKWHPLIAKHKNQIHKHNHSVRGKVISETDIPEEDWQDYIVTINLD